jgi:hypothetical protein
MCARLRPMPIGRASFVSASICFVACCQLTSACAAPEREDESDEATTSESAWSQATPLESKIERALALGVARGASEAFLSRPTSEGGVGLTAAAAKAIHSHRVGPDGKAGTADDGVLETYADLDALPNVAAATIQRLREFGWNGRFIQVSLPEDQLATAMTARGLFTALNPGSATLSCKTSSRYSVRSVAWNPVSDCEAREDFGTSSVTLSPSSSISSATIPPRPPASTTFTGWSFASSSRRTCTVTSPST